MPEGEKRKEQKKYLKQWEFSQTNVKLQTTELGSSENTSGTNAKINPLVISGAMAAFSNY